MSWDREELEQVATATELEFAARRSDDALSRYTVMWVAGVGASLYVRSAYGPDSAWYRRAIRYGRGRIRAGGVERDVVLDQVEPHDQVHAEIDAAYHAKYDQYGPRIVGTVVGPDASSVTLRLDPAHWSRHADDDVDTVDGTELENVGPATADLDERDQAAACRSGTPHTVGPRHVWRSLASGSGAFMAPRLARGGGRCLCTAACTRGIWIRQQGSRRSARSPRY